MTATDSKSDTNLKAMLALLPQEVANAVVWKINTPAVEKASGIKADRDRAVNHAQATEVEGMKKLIQDIRDYPDQQKELVAEYHQSPEYRNKDRVKPR